MGFEEELQLLFSNLSISNSETLPTKAHRFVGKLFQQYPRVEVPHAGWFSKFIPNSDPHGITYDALVRLEQYALTYSPDAPQDIWDTAPLKVLIRWYLQAGCQAYRESRAHQVSCTWLDCEVCVREEELIGDSLRCWQLREWSERYREDLAKMPQHEGPIACIPPQVLGELKRRLEY